MLKRLKRDLVLGLVCVVAWVIMVVVPGQASALSLSYDLVLGGGSITQGDLMFDQFQIGVWSTDGDPASIQVEGATVGASQGLRFSGNLGFTGNTPGLSTITSFSYRVSSLDADLVISEMGGSSSAMVTSGGGLDPSVRSHSVALQDPPSPSAIPIPLPLGPFPGPNQGEVVVSHLTNPTAQTELSAKLSPIYVFAELGRGAVHGTYVIEHTYAVEPVPLPASLLFFGSGLIGLSGLRRFIY